MINYCGIDQYQSHNMIYQIPIKSDRTICNILKLLLKHCLTKKEGLIKIHSAKLKLKAAETIFFLHYMYIVEVDSLYIIMCIVHPLTPPPQCHRQGRGGGSECSGFQYYCKFFFALIIVQSSPTT